MSKERLEEIKNSYLEGIHSLFGTSWVSMPKESFDWLMEQVERVEELKLEINDWREEVQKWQQFYEESEESYLKTKELLKSIVNQSKRYKQALEEILNVDCNLEGLDAEKELDRVTDIALKALEGENNE